MSFEITLSFADPVSETRRRRLDGYAQGIARSLQPSQLGKVPEHFVFLLLQAVHA